MPSLALGGDECKVGGGGAGSFMQPSQRPGVQDTSGAAAGPDLGGPMTASGAGRPPREDDVSLDPLPWITRRGWAWAFWVGLTTCVALFATAYLAGFAVVGHYQDSVVERSCANALFDVRGPCTADTYEPQHTIALCAFGAACLLTLTLVTVTFLRYHRRMRREADACSTTDPSEPVAAAR